jgi:transposase-like protein
MPKPPQKRTAEYKLQIAIDSLKGDKTIVQIASEHGLHPRQVTRWRNQLLIEGKEIFTHKSTLNAIDPDPDKKHLLHMIEQLSLELDFLKKKLKRND